MNASTPRSIADYLDQLRAELRGADPAMIQDALYDAEEHLRAELAENPQCTESEMLARVVASYGAPAEVADIYRSKEVEVESALRLRPLTPIGMARQRVDPVDSVHALKQPTPPTQRSAFARFFGIAADPRSYAALFYLLLALATGIFYFTWVTVGLSLSVGLSILIIGLPFIVLFFGTVRALALVEGRLVEVMLGVRMPRRPRYSDRTLGIWQRIGAMFTDPRTWSTLLYMLLMLPLGTAYFTIAVTLLSTSVALIFAPLLHIFVEPGVVVWQDGAATWSAPLWSLPLLSLAGIALLFITLHVARGIAYLHGRLARRLLVDTAPV